MTTTRSRTTESARPLTRSIASATAGRGRGADLRHSFVVAVIEGRGVSGRGDVGLCAIDLITSECIMAQYADTLTYTRTLQLLNALGPIEIVVCGSPSEQQQGKTKLVKMLENAFGEDTLQAVARKYFNDMQGMHLVRLLCITENLPALELQISQQFFTLAATAALLRYVETTHKVAFINHTLRIRVHKPEGTMMIDCNTARNLELVINGHSAHDRKHTLFGVLNGCGTAMGARLLRSNLLQPLADVSSITARQNAVECILRAGDSLFALHDALKMAPDLDHLVSQLIQVDTRTSARSSGATTATSVSMSTTPSHLNVRVADRHITVALNVRRALQSGRTILDLLDAFETTHDPLLSAVHRALSDQRLVDLSDLIAGVLSDESETETLSHASLASRHARCFAVQNGVNPLLDVARQTYSETVKDVNEHVAALCEAFTDLRINLKLTASVGFILSIDRNPRQLPSVFINPVARQSHIQCSTMQLVKLNERLNEIINEAILLSDRVIGELLDCLRADVSLLYKLSESLGLLDLFVSLAHNASLYDYVRPEFGDALCIQGGKHPIRYILDTKRPFVPNDTFCDLSCNFQIITGPNMSGKSTYLRQVALLHIMAHIGSFLPATFARLRVTDRLFTRLSDDAGVEANASTFYLEMLEMASCLQHLTPSSLVIVDELGRGTAPQDGLGLSFAISEQLLLSRAFTFFATHFSSLEALEVYPNVVSFQLQMSGAVHDRSEDDSGGIDPHQFKVSSGWCRADRYGLQMAKTVGFPAGMLRAAGEIADLLLARRPQLLDRESIEGGGSRARASLQLCQSVCHLLAMWPESGSPQEDSARLLQELQSRARDLIQE